MLANIAGGENAGDAGLHVFIDRNLSNRRQRQHTVQELRVGFQTDANEYPFDLQTAFCARVPVLDLKRCDAVCADDLFDPGSTAKFDLGVVMGSFGWTERSRSVSNTIRRLARSGLARSFLAKWLCVCKVIYTSYLCV